MSIGQNIKRCRKELDMTLEDVAVRVGVSRQTLSRYETGVIGNIPSDKIEALARVLSTTPAALMGWDSPECLSPCNTSPLPGACGIPPADTAERGEPDLDIENTSVSAEVPRFIDADFALRCKGDSMINARIFDGDIVYIRKQPSVANGEIAAVRIDGETALRRVTVYPDKIILDSANPLFDPIVFRGDEMSRVEILGKAVAFTGTLK